MHNKDIRLFQGRYLRLLYQNPAVKSNYGRVCQFCLKAQRLIQINTFYKQRWQATNSVHILTKLIQLRYDLTNCKNSPISEK